MIRFGRLGAFWQACTLIILLPGVAFSQTPAVSSPLTLDMAIARARESNPTLVAARLNRVVAAARIRVAREMPNPEVTYEASKETPRQSIGFALPVELGGKRQRRIDVANAGVAATDADLAVTEAEIENDVRRAYFALAGADAEAAIARGSRDLAARARQAAVARVAAGDAARLEGVQADVAFLDADNTARAAEAESIGSRAELNVLLGQPVDAPVTIAALTRVVNLPSVNDAIARAAQSSVTLAALDRRIDEQVAQGRLARALAFPDVTVGTALTYDAEPEFSKGWRVSFGAAIPLFTRARTQGLVDDATLAGLRAQRAAAAATIAGSVASALARANAAGDQLTRYESEILPRVAELETMAEDAYTSGQSGLSALLQALQSARDVRARAVEAGVVYQTALADLERGMGAALPR